MNNLPYKKNSNKEESTHAKLNRQGRHLLCALILSASPLAMAVSTTAVSLDDIKQAYQQKEFNKTIELSKDYLKTYPNDVDVRYYLGLAYKQSKQCTNAINEFKTILVQSPQYKEAKAPLVDCYFANHDYRSAKQLIDEDLVQNPQDPTMNYLDAKQAYLSGERSTSIKKLQSYTKAHPEDKEAQTLLDNLQAEARYEQTLKRKKPQPKSPAKPTLMADNEERIISHPPTLTPIRQPVSKSPYNLTGIWTDAMSVNTPNQMWNYTQLYYYRINDWGQFGGSVNYAERYDNQAAQVEINAIPKLNDRVSLDLAYAYADAPELFANDLTRGELWVFLPQAFEGSFGGAHRQIASFILDSITGTVGKYIGNFYFSARPTYFIPGSGPRSLFYTLRARYYGERENQYIGVVYGNGTSPDLTDLLTVDYIKVRNRLYMVEGQQPMTHSLAFTYAGGYEELYYPSDLLRTLVHMSLGLKYRFD